MALRIAAHPWGETPLGDIATWPSALKQTISLMIPSPVPLVLLWGEPGVMLYNDAYAEFAGARDARLLGSNVREGWDEVADFNDNVMRVGLAGGTLSYTDYELTLFRNGNPERVFMNLDYSPVRDATGRPCGVFAVVVETTQARTDRVLLERNALKLGFLDRLSNAIAQERDADAVLASITSKTAEHLGIAICAYADMDADGDGFTIRGDWHHPDLPPIVGHYSLADFGALAVSQLNAGRPLIIRDNQRELPPQEARTFQDIGVAATICMPLVKGGRLTALMAVHDRRPRDWTDYELEIISEVSERSWAHIERVRAEADLRRAALALGDLNETLEQRVVDRTAQLMQVEDELRQLQKMEAVGQMTGGLAHDFNNLLTGIGGAVEAIRKRVADDETGELDRYFAAARSSINRAASITHRLLAFSRQQALDPRGTDVHSLVVDLSELVQRTIGPEISLEIVPGADLWPVRIDRNQLENALLNLCINARDAMPDGGSLTIRLDNAELPNTDELHAPGTRDVLSIAVSDTGSGMSPEVLAKVFDPFFTTKPLGKGTGLGLSMVYGFVRQSGGEVRIESAPGKGTTVRLLLPRQTKVDETHAPAPAPPEASPGQGRGTILVTEDEPFIRMLIVGELEDEGYTVLEAEDGRAAIEAFELQPEIDLLVTDVGLPNGMSGAQLAGLARERIPGLKVVFITGYADTAIAGPNGLEHGMALVTKPFEMPALARVIRGLLNG